MAASASAILTLLAIVFVGPLYYALRHLYHRVYSPLRHLRKKNNAHTAGLTPDDEEYVSTSAYMISLVGYAVGIGNVWRFPYLVGQFGGGAFVFAYIVSLFLIAMPLYFVELGIGQYTRLGTIGTLTSK